MAAQARRGLSPPRGALEDLRFTYMVGVAGPSSHPRGRLSDVGSVGRSGRHRPDSILQLGQILKEL